MVEVASQQPSLNTAYTISSAEHLPFYDCHFDAVTVFSAFHWFDGYTALREFRRVLKPCGLVAIVNKFEKGTLKQEFRDLLRSFTGNNLPDVKKRYDPVHDLVAAGVVQVSVHEAFASEYFTIEEAVAYFRSVSLWNLITPDNSSAASAALYQFCEKHSQQGYVCRDIVVRTVLGYVGG